MYLVICKTCGQVFMAGSPSQKYCSGGCRSRMQWQKAREAGTVHTCPQCGKEFIKKGTFCSRGCYNAAVKGGWKKGEPYTPVPVVDTEGVAGAWEDLPLLQYLGTPAGAGGEGYAPGAASADAGAMKAAPVGENRAGRGTANEYVRKISLKGFRNPSETEAAAVKKRIRKHVRGKALMDAALAALIGAIWYLFVLVYGLTAQNLCLGVLFAAALLNLCCHAIQNSLFLSRRVNQGYFRVTECTISRKYMGAWSQVELKNGQRCLDVFYMDAQGIACLKKDPDAVFLLARCFRNGESDFVLLPKNGA